MRAGRSLVEREKLVGRSWKRLLLIANAQAAFCTYFETAPKE
jgi:hypothetical protein